MIYYGTTFESLLIYEKNGCSILNNWLQNQIMTPYL